MAYNPDVFANFASGERGVFEDLLAGPLAFFADLADEWWGGQSTIYTTSMARRAVGLNFHNICSAIHDDSPCVLGDIPILGWRIREEEGGVKQTVLFLPQYPLVEYFSDNTNEEAKECHTEKFCNNENDGT